MMKGIEKYNFRKWNEEMCVKYNPEKFHNSQNIFIRWIEGKRVRKILKDCLHYKGEKILEVGCGAGNILEKIPLDKLYGMDISDGLLKRAKVRLGKKAYLFWGNGERMPLKNSSFDMAICTEVIEHTENPQILLENIYNILKSDGKLVISIPNEGLINFLKKLYFSFFIFRHDNSTKDSKYKIARKMDDEWHLHEFKITAFIKLLERYFEVSQIHRIPYYFLPVRYVVSCLKR